MNKPAIVPAAEWQRVMDEQLRKEKAHTKAADALAARRRRMPMVEVDKAYTFTGAAGEVRLVDLFEGRRQLITYTFMWHGVDDVCSGCAMFTDNIGHLAHLHARDTSLALVSRGPIAEIGSVKQRMGWSIPWYSSLGNDFNVDMGAGDGFAVNVFLRDGDAVYRTYFTTARGVERLGSTWTFLDLTPFGRQETWEDSPEGWPQTAPYQWWRLHDEPAAGDVDGQVS
ncbi:putative dithiol-disulfide oxidoreductase (DUF899 family) [Tamaricihabitans halophyticus]|uniref:Putative dithiol-disulfide oxidoreductase (DUF899 family) n=1 Tax=Tamaricihabitans halophyticus TaxID=1262583 RepID=A0A4R2Q9D6_9PSEU|nr:DUF899 domain-containing protein [Tamaricihabitans halophyticus]TCP43411.1 putative dithiol-disulfide oxidoreductase (DUF899 family) [Tamaricihabitans halophyticus]